MFFLINFFKFFQLTIQQPEICLQPHLLKNKKHTNESKNQLIIKFNNVKNIEFIINFKTDAILFYYTSSIELKQFSTLSLVSYDVIKEDTHLKLINEKEDDSFKLINRKNYFISSIIGDPFKQVISLMSFNNFSDKSFYNYISKTKGKAWKVVINIHNKRYESTCKLETLIFKLNDSKTELEIFKDGLLPITEISYNLLSEEELIKLDEVPVTRII